MSETTTNIKIWPTLGSWGNLFYLMYPNADQPDQLKRGLMLFIRPEILNQPELFAKIKPFLDECTSKTTGNKWAIKHGIEQEGLFLMKKPLTDHIERYFEDGFYVDTQEKSCSRSVTWTIDEWLQARDLPSQSPWIYEMSYEGQSYSTDHILLAERWNMQNPEHPMILLKNNEWNHWAQKIRHDKTIWLDQDRVQQLLLSTVQQKLANASASTQANQESQNNNTLISESIESNQEQDARKNKITTEKIEDTGRFVRYAVKHRFDFSRISHQWAQKNEKSRLIIDRIYDCNKSVLYKIKTKTTSIFEPFYHYYSLNFSESEKNMVDQFKTDTYKKLIRELALSDEYRYRPEMAIYFHVLISTLPRNWLYTDNQKTRKYGKWMHPEGVFMPLVMETMLDCARDVFEQTRMEDVSAVLSSMLLSKQRNYGDHYWLYHEYIYLSHHLDALPEDHPARTVFNNKRRYSITCELPKNETVFSPDQYRDFFFDLFKDCQELKNPSHIDDVQLMQAKIKDRIQQQIKNMEHPAQFLGLMLYYGSCGHSFGKKQKTELLRFDQGLDRILERTVAHKIFDMMEEEPNKQDVQAIVDGKYERHHLFNQAEIQSLLENHPACVSWGQDDIADFVESTLPGVLRTPEQHKALLKLRKATKNTADQQSASDLNDESTNKTDALPIPSWYDLWTQKNGLTANLLKKFERIGQPSDREGNITTQEFMKTFGISALQFGRSVSQKQRRSNLNEAYDALYDLARCLGIPKHTIGLPRRDGVSVALAIGARGKGGRSPAAAHFESGEYVINMTRRSGKGCLAHEWLHALDAWMYDVLEKPIATDTMASHCYRHQNENPIAQSVDLIKQQPYPTHDIHWDTAESLTRFFITGKTSLHDWQKDISAIEQEVLNRQSTPIDTQTRINVIEKISEGIDRVIRLMTHDLILRGNDAFGLIGRSYHPYHIQRFLDDHIKTSLMESLTLADAISKKYMDELVLGVKKFIEKQIILKRLNAFIFNSIGDKRVLSAQHSLTYQSFVEADRGGPNKKPYYRKHEEIWAYVGSGLIERDLEQHQVHNDYLTFSDQSWIHPLEAEYLDRVWQAQKPAFQQVLGLIPEPIFNEDDISLRDNQEFEFAPGSVSWPEHELNQAHQQQKEILRTQLQSHYEQIDAHFKPVKQEDKSGIMQQIIQQRDQSYSIAKKIRQANTKVLLAKPLDPQIFQDHSLPEYWSMSETYEMNEAIMSRECIAPSFCNGKNEKGIRHIFTMFFHPEPAWVLCSLNQHERELMAIQYEDMRSRMKKIPNWSTLPHNELFQKMAEVDINAENQLNLNKVKP